MSKCKGDDAMVISLGDSLYNPGRRDLHLLSCSRDDDDETRSTLDFVLTDRHARSGRERQGFIVESHMPRMAYMTKRALFH